jgi:hypothetical protein
MTIEELENAIVEKLKSGGFELAIEAFPEKPADHRLHNAAGAILVIFGGSKFGESQATDTVVQNRTISFSIVVKTSSLRSHLGAYPVLDAIRRLLTGFEPPECDKMYPTSEELVDREGSIWTYEAQYSCETLAVEDTDLPGGPAVTKVTFVNSDYGNVEVERP